MVFLTGEVHGGPVVHHDRHEVLLQKKVEKFTGVAGTEHLNSNERMLRSKICLEMTNRHCSSQ